MIKKNKALLTLTLILLSAGIIGMVSNTLAAGNSLTGSNTAEYLKTDEPYDSGLVTLKQTTQAQQPMRSREIIEEGIYLEFSGILKRMAGDGWYLDVDQVLHQLYMAPADIIEESGITLNEGKEVMISGFFYSEEGDMTGIIAVCTILIDGEKYRFREDDGTPVWRGRGSGGGRRTG